MYAFLTLHHAYRPSSAHTEQTPVTKEDIIVLKNDWLTDNVCTSRHGHGLLLMFL